ncbi:MAG: DUF4270 family protein [Rikenellaceae bacterium]
MDRFRSIKCAIVALATAILLAPSCAESNLEIGEGLIPSSQQMELGQILFEGEDLFSTCLFQSDSINSANLSYGYLGKQSHELFGRRQANLFTQYLLYDVYDEDILGVDPTIDSMMIYLYPDEWSGDTTKVQTYEIFEITNNSFITERADTIFFTNYVIPESAYDSSKPIFTFSFPDPDNGIYTDTEGIRLTYTDFTDDYLNRLLMLESSGEERIEAMGDDESFVEHMLGYYIRPTADSDEDAALFSTDMSFSCIIAYCTINDADAVTDLDEDGEDDPVYMVYQFYISDADDAGNVSINTFEREGSTFTSDEYTSTATLRVEGAGGVVSALTLKDTIFKKIDEIIEEANETITGDKYTSVLFNQAELRIYMPAESSASYDYSSINSLLVTPWLDDSIYRLGLYSRYAWYNEEIDDIEYTTLIGVEDYTYTYESSGYSIDFNGYLNRSWGAYVMNIPTYLQQVWNDYEELKEEADGGEVNFDEIEDLTIYLAPAYDYLFSLKYSSMQGGVDAINNAPMRLKLTYTLIK